MNLIELLYKRYTSDTPKFWKRVAAFGVALTVISGGIYAAPEGVFIPEILTKIASYCATAGFVITLISGAATKDQNLSEK